MNAFLSTHFFWFQNGKCVPHLYKGTGGGVQPPATRPAPTFPINPPSKPPRQVNVDRGEIGRHKRLGTKALNQQLSWIPPPPLGGEGRVPLGLQKGPRWSFGLVQFSFIRLSVGKLGNSKIRRKSYTFPNNTDQKKNPECRKNISLEDPCIMR